MVKRMIPSRWAFGLLFLCVTQVQAGMFTEQPKKLVEERSYAGFFGNLSSIDRSGDFNGTLTITPASSSGPQDTSLIPRIDRSFGGGALVGYRKNEYAIEVSYWRSQHVAQFEDVVIGQIFESKAIYQSINLDLKRYFLPRLVVQPYLQMGICLPWLNVKDASNPYPVVVGVPPSDASFSGFGFDLTVGLEGYLNDTFSVYGAIQQRWANFSKVKGYYRTTEDVMMGTTTTSLKGNGVNFLAGVNVNLL